MCIDVPVRVGGWLVCVDLVLLCGVPENLYLGVVPRLGKKPDVVCRVYICGCVFILHVHSTCGCLGGIWCLGQAML
jgi:hypothetical protein